MTTYATIAQAGLYGFRVMYALKVEGIPFIFVEKAGLGGDPSGYEQDGSLIVDDSAAIGSRISRSKGIGVGYDLSVTLQRTTTTKLLFKTPEKLTSLAATLDWDETSAVAVEDVTGWTTTDFAYIGRELITFNTIDSGANEFQSISRGSPNGEWKAYQFDVRSAVSTWVTNAPMFWKGRQVKLYAVPVDAYGSVPGANILTNAALIWRGRISKHPRPGRVGWSFPCTSIERELEKPFGAPITASGTLVPNADPIVTIYNPDQGYLFGISDMDDTDADGYPTYFSDTLIPFSSYTAGDKVRLSEIRSTFKSAFNTAAAGWAYFSNGRWVKTTLDGGDVGWQFVVDVQREPTGMSYGANTRAYVIGGDVDEYYGVPTSPAFVGANDVGLHFGAYHDGTGTNTNNPLPDTSSGDYFTWKIGIFKLSAKPTSSIPEVTSDTGDVNDIPTAGWARFERDGAEAIFRYDSVEVDSVGNKLLLVLQNDGPSPSQFPMSNPESGDAGFTVEFLGRVAGPYSDVMRKLIMSSGRGDNDATWDDLDASWGYDIESVDTQSFDDFFDGSWAAFDSEMVIDADRSFSDLFGGLLELSQLAIVPRPTTDGSQIRLAAVRTGFSDTAVSAATITDDELVRVSGRSPVRHVDRVEPPNIIDITFKVVNDEQKHIIRDLVVQRQEGTNKRDLTVNGVYKSQAIGTVTTWAASFFFDRRTVESYEIDVVPWVDVKIGDAITINTSHWGIVNAATGELAYNGPARVIGIRNPPAKSVQTLTVLTGGSFVGRTLCPAWAVSSWTGSASGPSAVRFNFTTSTTNRAQRTYDLLSAYLESSDPFRLIAFRPSYDSAGSEYYECDGVTLSLGSSPPYVEVSVSSTGGTFTLDTDHFLTIPATANANAAQQRHAHADDGGFFV